MPLIAFGDCTQQKCFRKCLHKSGRRREGVLLHYKIAALPGDGIGPEIMAEAVLLLQAITARFGHSFDISYGRIGGIAIDEDGHPLPASTLAICSQSDAVLLGAVGGPKWEVPAVTLRPEAGLLGLRKALGLYANIRPITLFQSLLSASPLRPEVIAGTDLIILRELTGGLYFGEPRGRYHDENGLRVVDTLCYTEVEIERILRLGFEMASRRRGKLTSVDKANVLESSRVWREIAIRLAPEYPDVTLSHLLVDNAAMQIVRQPATFDVIVTENLFGDILSDEAAVITGSIGMLPSASLGAGTRGLYEPVHGSAPDIAGQGLANPLATFLSVAMMFRWSFALEEEASTIEFAVRSVLDAGYRTRDLVSPNAAYLGTCDMGACVRNAVIGGGEDVRKDAV